MMAQSNERLKDAKRIFEGECCALAYNDDEEWFDDEDEEFSFTDDNSWFEAASEARTDEIFQAYLEIKNQKSVT